MGRRAAKLTARHGRGPRVHFRYDPRCSRRKTAGDGWRRGGHHWHRYVWCGWRRNPGRIANAARVVDRIVDAADAAWAVGDTANAGILRERYHRRAQAVYQ